MERLREKFFNFMNGRYGSDQLFYGLSLLYLMLVIVNLFVKSTALAIFSWLDFIFMFYRIYSKNIYKRRLENEKFLKFWLPVKAKLSLSYRKVREIKTHRYRTCPNCKTTIRLPRKKGEHMVKCPRCSNRFEVKIRW